MGAISQDVQLAEYEPSRIAPSKLWLAARVHTLHRLRAMIGPLLLLPNEEPLVARHVAHRLDVLADELGRGSKMNELATDAAGPRSDGEKDRRYSSAVGGLVLTDLEALESTLRGPEGGVSAHASA